MVEELYKCYEVLDKAADKLTEVDFCLISVLITDFYPSYIINLSVQLGFSLLTFLA